MQYFRGSHVREKKSHVPSEQDLILILQHNFILSGQLVMTLANLEGEESFNASMLGNAEEVVQDRICDDELLLVKG